MTPQLKEFVVGVEDPLKSRQNYQKTTDQSSHSYKKGHTLSVGGHRIKSDLGLARAT